ncbi:Phage Tail Protein X [compost metagenome]
MMAQYKTRDGDVVDEIVWRFYGTRGGLATERVLEVNKGLADRGPVLPGGVLLTLPDLPKPVATKTLKLWD